MNNEKDCKDCIYYNFGYCESDKDFAFTVEEERTTGDCGEIGKNFTAKSEPMDEWD